MGPRKLSGRANSQAESVSAFDGAKTGPEPDPHDRGDATADVAPVAQHQDGASSGEQ
jgi:hypothetical protein